MDQAASRCLEAELIWWCQKMPVASMKAPLKCRCTSLENIEMCDRYTLLLLASTLRLPCHCTVLIGALVSVST